MAWLVCCWSICICRTIAKKSNPLDIVGLILFGSGIALLSYVLEVFGEHTLSVREILGLLAISVALLAGYGLHATQIPFPLLRSEPVSHSHFSRGGERQLLHAAGHRRNPVHPSAALSGGPGVHAHPIRPADHAAGHCRDELEDDHAAILSRFGYRGVLISNTVILGVLILLFATIGVGTPVWLIVIQAFCYGFFSSLQYTSMNTLVYADVTEEQTSGASSIASTMQQMSISFGVATASLLTALFIPDRFHTSAPEMIHGIHYAFFVLGGITVLSTIVFRELKSKDGANTSQHKILEHAA